MSEKQEVADAFRAEADRLDSPTATKWTGWQQMQASLRRIADDVESAGRNQEDALLAVILEKAGVKEPESE